MTRATSRLPLMKSPSTLDQARAVFRKDWHSESQSRQGLLTALQFGLVTVVSIAFAGLNGRPGASLAAGLLTVALLFTAVLTIPRGFLAEEDQGTFAWLHRLVRPEAIYWGKFAGAVAQVCPAALTLAIIYTAMTGQSVASWPLLVVSVVVLMFTYAATTCLAGLLVLGASNRWLLVAAISTPLLLPETTMAVVAIRASYGFGDAAAGWRALAGLGGFFLGSALIAPVLARELLKVR